MVGSFRHNGESRITDKILPVAKEWQHRPLESMYAVAFLDAIHYTTMSTATDTKRRLSLPLRPIFSAWYVR